LRNIELVKSLGLADQEVRRLNATTEKILKLELKKVRYLRSLSFIQGTFVNLLRTSILFLMLYLIFTQKITVGQFFSLLIYSFFIFGPLQDLGTSSTRIAKPRFRSTTSARYSTSRKIRSLRIRFLSRPEHARVPERQLHSPDASTPALNDISFSVERGDTIAFVGSIRSGQDNARQASRRTLSAEGRRDSLQRLLEHGDRPRQAARENRLRYSGHAALLGDDRENLLFVRPDATDIECLEVMHKAAADSLLARADKGLDTVIGEGGVKVSAERNSAFRSLAPCCVSRT
jgi:ATP-binding cassette subfamily B protein